MRKAAYEAEGAWFDAHRAELDELYDKLVKNRTARARKLGYENFIPLAPSACGASATRWRTWPPTVRRSKRFRARGGGTEEAAVCLHRRGGPEILRRRVLLCGRKPCAPRHAGRNTGRGPRNVPCPSAPRRRNSLTKCSTEACSTCSPRRARPRAATAPTRADYKAPFIFSNFNGTSGRRGRTDA